MGQFGNFRLQPACYYFPIDLRFLVFLLANCFFSMIQVRIARHYFTTERLMKSHSSSAILVILALACSSILVFGQGTDLGTIRGTVTDSSGAMVANASVTAIDEGTGASRETKTNSHGEYQIFGLPSGSYKVRIANQGMATAEITGLVLNGSDVVSANAALKVSTATEQVVVTAEAATIDSSDQTISDTISHREIIELPRDSRDVYSFLYLNPNITQGVSDGEFKFLGFQSYGANFTIDGQRSTNTIFGSPTSSQPSLEAIGELNVLSNDFSAEYAGIANIRITTKRGGNGYHGSVYYDNKNSALAAWQIQDKQAKTDFVPSQFVSKFPTPYFNYNDIAGTLGGPIPGLKRTWFFAAYERNYSRLPVSFTSSRLPHPSLWVGDYSQLIVDNTLQTQALLPDVPASVTLTPTEIAQDTYCVGWPNCTQPPAGQQFVTIPARLLNPNTQQLINTYFPKISTAVDMNTGTGGITDLFQTLVPGGTTRDLGTVRLDHDLTDRDHIYGVYNVQSDVGGTTPVNAPFTGLGLTQNDIRDNTISGSYVRTIRNNLINEVRAGFNREHSVRHSNTTLESFLTSIGFDSSAINAYAAVVGQSQLSTHGNPFIDWGSRFTFGRHNDRNTDRELSQYLTTFGDTLTWVIGKHNLKMGGDIVRNVGLDGFVTGRGDPRGGMAYDVPSGDFDCQISGTPGPCLGAATDRFANFTLGLAPSRVTFINSARPNMDVHNWEQGYFFQDDWKFSSRLTLNLGLRYEVVTPYVDKNDIMLNFDPTPDGIGRFIVSSDKTLQYLDPRFALTAPVVTAANSGLGIGRGLVRTDKNNLAPRVGAAMRLGEKSVVRGGYGIYYPTTAAQGIRDPLATNAFNQSLTKSSDPTTNAFIQPWPTPLTGGVTSALTGAPSVNAVPVGLHQPLVQQYNGTFERELGLKTSVRFSYIGITAHGLIAGTDLNELTPSDVGWGLTLADPNTGIGDGINACDPDSGDCGPTQAELNKTGYPLQGDFLVSYGNFGHSQSNAFQTQVERRGGGLTLNASYTYLDQKSTGLDQGNSSLGGVAYNPFNPDRDYAQDSWVSRHRFVLFGLYDLPVGRGRKFGSSFSSWTDAVIGGWQTSFQMFAKTGTGFTPFWVCDNCFNSVRFVGPGNIATSSIDAVGDFGGAYRPIVTGNPNHHVGEQIFDPNAFGPPPLGADVFDNPQVAKRNLLWGPGGWGVNLGVHKNFRFGERVVASLGADFNNIFNHPIRMPDVDFGGSFDLFANVGNIAVVPSSPTTLTYEYVAPNSEFGKANRTFTQEGIDSRRTVRLRLRVTF
jgi:Carboxypeptidase regulatory-like domain/TonB dependent receptor